MVMQNLLGSMTPAGAFSNGGPIALGTALRFDVDGWVYGLRMFVSADFNPAVHSPYLGSLWQTTSPDDQSHTGLRLGVKEYPNVSVTPDAWNEVLFDTPVSVTADTPYKVIYYAASGRYVAITHFFIDNDYVNGDIIGFQHGSTTILGGQMYNGTYNETSDPVEHYTVDTFNQNNYLSDVIFSTDDPGGGGGDTGAASRFMVFF